MATVTIACNVPGGLVLGYADAPNGQPTVPVLIRGPPPPTANPATPGYGFTDIDETFWTNWLATYGDRGRYPQSETRIASASAPSAPARLPE